MFHRKLLGMDRECRLSSVFFGSIRGTFSHNRFGDAFWSPSGSHLARFWLPLGSCCIFLGSLLESFDWIFQLTSDAPNVMRDVFAIVFVQLVPKVDMKYPINRKRQIQFENCVLSTMGQQYHFDDLPKKGGCNNCSCRRSSTCKSQKTL